MGKHRKLPVIVMYLAMYAAAGLLIFSAMGYRQNGLAEQQAAVIDSVSLRVDGGVWQTVTLPYTVEDLPAGASVSIRTEFQPKQYDCVYAKFAYTPAEVYFNDQLVLTAGRRESYPSFLNNPPPESHLIKVGQPNQIEMTAQYLAPEDHDPMVLYPYLVGTSSEILFDLAKRLGTPMILALVQIITGCIMLISSLCLMALDTKGQVFFWLGLFSKFSGIWFLCANEFSVLCFKNDSLLYLLSFIGFFSFSVPLLRFFRTAIGFSNPRQLSYLEAVSAVAAVVAMLLQVTGTVALTESMRFFNIFLPVTLFLTTMIILRESITEQNAYAKRFVLPIGILAVSSLMEMFDYHIVNSIFSSMIQAGMFIFLFLISIIAGMGLKDSFDLKKQEKQLAQERSMLNIQMEEQRKNGLQLAKNEQEVSRQRHDLRHHLAAIQELSGDNAELQAYLASLTKHIPKARARFCENTVVNAVVSHYAEICEQEEIQFTVDIAVPEGKTQIEESNLCVIFANLLENAVEACERMENGAKFIRLKSGMHLGILTVTMDNSFNGEVRKRGECFLSSKRNDVGIGLSSVQSIARDAEGDADFHAEGNVFLSSVYLRI